MRVALSIIACLVLVVPVTATDYFLDSREGSDDNAGTSEAQAWASLDRLAEVELQPGDSVSLRRGCTYRGRLRLQGSGAEGAPVRIGTWGEGDKPEILGSVLLDGWEQVEGEVYRATVPEKLFFGHRNLFSIFEYDGAIPVRLTRDDASPTERGHFHFDTETLQVSVMTTDGASPAEHRLEVPVIDQLVDLRDWRWLIIEDLSFLFGNCRHLGFRGCADVTIRNCASLFVGQYGNPNLLILDSSERVEVLDCFLYESINCGIYISSGSNHCRVAGCTIARCASNDGVTCHSGGRDEQGVRQGLTGDYCIIEDNVIGLCPEESIDITSGDHHIVRRNICYGNGNPGIIIGHDSDHTTVERNISFGNQGGIYVGGKPEEGSRGHNRIIRNLCYDNTYPGVEVLGINDTLVLGNTIVNSRERVNVRINSQSSGTILRNNIIATLEHTIPHMLVHFIRGTPESVTAEMSHNLLYHAADVRKREVFFPAGQLIRTDDGGFTPQGFLARYQIGEATIVGEPGFRSPDDGYFALSEDSPAVDAGTEVDLPYAGEAPDIGWWEVGGENEVPQYPPALIDGDADDEAEILRLWGKG
ncbi:MAG: right-handed parallel beta-helix repeat-containing protein [Armatimonadota bacterium]|nr:right-handed parallel beta-helix repeat-containing protein [Armatimonadota bacterium]